VLEQLYSLSARELLSQHCILIGQSELMAISIASTLDRHGRQSLLLATATVDISWDHTDLGDAAARLVGLSSRLASAYATAINTNPESLQNQLKENLFLPGRSFDLNDEKPNQDFPWNKIFSSVRRWKPIRGVATPKLVGIGANVLVGTKHEAERVLNQFKVDGYFDVREMEIHALSGRLSLWEKSTVASSVAEETPPDVRREEIQALRETLVRIEDKLTTLTDHTINVFNLLTRLETKRRK